MAKVSRVAEARARARARARSPRSTAPTSPLRADGAVGELPADGRALAARRRRRARRLPRAGALVGVAAWRASCGCRSRSRGGAAAGGRSSPRRRRAAAPGDPAARAVKFSRGAQYAEAIDRLRDVEVRHTSTTARAWSARSCSASASPASPCARTATAPRSPTAARSRRPRVRDVALFQQLRVGMVFTPLAIILLNTYAGSFERAQRYLMREERARRRAAATSACAVELSACAPRAPRRASADEAADAGADAPAAEEVKEAAARSSCASTRSSARAASSWRPPARSEAQDDAAYRCSRRRAAPAAAAAARPSATPAPPRVAFVVSGTIRENVLMGRR